MESLKTISTLGLAALLASVSGIAMAEGCGDGVLLNENFDSGLRVSDESSCTIIGSTISGDLRVINVRNVLLVNNRIDGEIRLDGNAKTGTANVIENTVFNGNLVVEDYEAANVIGNETLNNKLGNIKVNSNIGAFVQQNISARNLICAENTSLDASYNVANKQEKCK